MTADRPVSAYPSENIARDVAGRLATEHLRTAPSLRERGTGARELLARRCAEVNRPDLADSLHGVGDSAPGQKLVEALLAAYPTLLEELEHHALHGPVPTPDAYALACAALAKHSNRADALAGRLADASEAILGTVENGPWALITDPALRQLVRDHVADTCHTIALAAGLDTAAEVAHDACPVRLATSLPTTPTTDPKGD